MNALNRLYLLLLAFLCLGAGEPGEGDEPLPEDAGGTGDETLDDLLDVVEPPADASAAPDDAAKDNAAVKEARRRAQDAENQLATERNLRAQAEARANPPQRYVDPDWEREEKELADARAGGDAAQLAWMQWKVDGSRRIRAAERNSSASLMQAQDLQDRTAFERLEITKPQVFKRYGARVEAAMNEMRQRGQNAPRLAVLRLLIGDDIMNGKVKPKKAAEPVERGRSPGLRSDVPSKGRLTEQQKRIARLENQII